MEKTISDLKNALVLHNPGAGEGDTSRRALLRSLKLGGFECSYSSTKQFRWENIETEDPDFLVLAGGDGTVRKVAEEILSRKLIEKKLPLGLLPVGTANNIARTLGLPDDPDAVIASWRDGGIKKFDVGVIKGLPDATFFLESFGYGLFPGLMHEMKKQNKNGTGDARERIRAALDLLRTLLDSASTKKCHLEIDDQDCSGEFVLLEVMNTRSMGPNLTLAPDADPGDGSFEVVVIREEQRHALRQYLDEKMEGRDVPFDFPLYKAKNRLVVHWDGKHVHVDDEYEKIEKAARIEVEIRRGLLDFLVPAGTT